MSRRPRVGFLLFFVLVFLFVLAVPNGVRCCSRCVSLDPEGLPPVRKDPIGARQIRIITAEDDVMSGWAALGAGIGQAIGGQKDRISNRKTATRDRALQWYLASHGVRLRVADAQAAGVHPLFALGGQFPMSSPAGIPSSGSGEAFGNIGAGIGSMLDRDRVSEDLERRAARANVRILEARANEAEDIVEQQRRASVVARAGQAANVQQDLIKLMPDQMTSGQSSDPSVSAGKAHPAYRQYTITQWGLQMDLPYSEEGPSEALENIPVSLWPAIIAHNRAKYGDDWGTRFYQEFVLGKPPKYRPASEDPRRFMGQEMERLRRKLK